MSIDHTAFLRDLSRFVGRLVSSHDVDETLDELAADLTRHLALTGSAVNLARDGVLENVSAIPADIADLEQIQSDTGTGPCVEAFRSGTAVTIADLDVELAEGAWPEYRAVAEKHGMRAVAGIPMRLGGRTVGVVNLYSREPRTWSEVDLSAAQVMADIATSYLIGADLLEHEHRVNQQLQQALDSRVVIEQAKGMVATANGVTVEQAFALIQKHARSRHTSIRAVSEAVVNLDLRL